MGSTAAEGEGSCYLSEVLDFPKHADTSTETPCVDSVVNLDGFAKTAEESLVQKISNVVNHVDSNPADAINLSFDGSSSRNVLEYNCAQARASPSDCPLLQSDSGALVLEGGNESEIDEHNSLSDMHSKSDVRFFLCGFCKKNPLLNASTPKLLPCLHSFCDSCLQQKYEKQKKASEAAGSQNSPRLKCPSCGQEFLVSDIDRPTVGFLNNQFVIESAVQNNSSDQTEHQCTSCDDKSAACSYCLNCNEWLCDVCVDAHKRVKVTKDHTIQPKTSNENENGPKTSSSKEKSLFCKIHPQEQLKLFCAPCDKLTCRDCQLTEHKEHRYQFIEEAAAKHRDILGKLLQYLQINLGLLKETITDVQKASDGLALQEKEVELEVNKSFEVLVGAIRKRQQVLVSELKGLVVSKQALLAKQKKDLMQMRVILEHNHDFAEFAVKGGSNVALLYSRKVLGTRLHNLNSLKYRQKPLAHQDLKFSMDLDKLCSYFSKTGAVYSQEDMHRKIEFYNNSGSQRSVPPNVGRSQPTMFSSSKQPTTPVEQTSKRVADVLSPVTPFINLNAAGNASASRRPQLPSSPYDSPSTHRLPVAGMPSHRPAPNLMVLSQGSGNHPPDSAGLSKAELTAKYIQHLKESAARKQDGIGASSLKPLSHPGLPLPSKTLHHHSSSATTANTNRLVSPNSMRRALPVTSSAWSRPAPGSAMGSTINELQKLVEATSQQNTTASSFQTPHNFCSMGVQSPSLSSNPVTGGNSSIVIKQEDGEGAPYVFPLSSSSSQDDAKSGESGFDENQSNEDYCGVCRNGGQLLCCDTCPKVFHLQCHVPAMTVLPNDSWSCGLCMALSSKSGPINKRKLASDGLTDCEIKVCEKILLHLFVHVDSLPFHHKVSKAQVPDYYKVISKPMDLTTIRSKIQSQNFAHYKSLDEFMADVRLVFANCYVYNAPESDVYKMGRKLESHFENLVNAHAPAYVSSPVEEEPPAKRRKDNRSILDDDEISDDP